MDEVVWKLRGARCEGRGGALVEGKSMHPVNSEGTKVRSPLSSSTCRKSIGLQWLFERPLYLKNKNLVSRRETSELFRNNLGLALKFLP